MPNAKHLTSSQLREFVDYNPETGVFIRKIGNTNAYPGKVAGSRNKAGYIVVWVAGSPYLAHRLAWLFVFGSWPSSFIDHINGKREDNRIANLRQASRAQNCQNAGATRRNTSGAKGVYWHRRDRVWRVKCSENGVNHDVGSFKEFKVAKAAYESFAREVHKEFFRP